MVTVERPAGIDCLDWEPDVRDAHRRRCRYYADNGTCALPVRLMCVEYLRRNPGLAASLPDRPTPTLPMAPPEPPPLPRVLDALQSPTPISDAGRVLAPATAPDGGEFALAPPPLKPPRKAAVADTHRPELLPSTAATAVGAAGDLARGARSLTEQRVEVALVSDVFGDITLVPEHTGQDRIEFTFDEVALLAAAVLAFPGCHMTGLRKT